MCRCVMIPGPYPVPKALKKGSCISLTGLDAATQPWGPQPDDDLLPFRVIIPPVRLPD